MENKFKFEIGQEVIYDGIIGKVESRDIYTDGRNGYGLVSIENEEISCTAMESEIEAYTGQEIDQSEALFMAHASSRRIQNLVDSLTDKYFRDGKH